MAAFSLVAQEIDTITPHKYTDPDKKLESSKMKCNTLSGKLFSTKRTASTKSVAYESLYSIEI